MSLTQGRHFSITIGSAIASVLTTSPLLTQLAAVGENEVEFSAISKEIEFKPSETSTSEVMLLGTTAGNQNSELDPQAPTKGEFTGTLICSPNGDNAYDLYAFKLTTTATTGDASDYTRYNYASASPTAGVCIAIQANQGTGKTITTWMMNNCTIESLGGVKVDADGHATQDVKISAAANDCYVEFDQNGGS